MRLSLAVVLFALCSCTLSPPDSVVLIECSVAVPPDVTKIFGITTAKVRGTGFAVNGKIYTCRHVIEDATEIIVVLSNGDRQKAALLRQTDCDTDLAELKIPNPPPSLRLRDTPPIVDEIVFQIGNPQMMDFVMVKGYFLGSNGWNMFLLDTYKGNSGSPILDKHWKVIGMTHSMIEGTRYTNGGHLYELIHFIYPTKPL